MFGNFSNVHLSSDGGNNWKQAYVNVTDQHPAGTPTPKNQAYHSIGLENTTCWQVHWQNANTMMGCFSDIGGMRSVDAGTSWGFIYRAFLSIRYIVLRREMNGIMYGACSNIHDMYQSTRLADAQLDANDANGKIVYSIKITVQHGRTCAFLIILFSGWQLIPTIRTGCMHRLYIMAVHRVHRQAAFTEQMT